MFKFSKLRLQPLDVRGTEGDRLELNCQARGSPPPRCCLDLITSLTMAIYLLVDWLIVLVSLTIIRLVAHHGQGEVGLINNQAINK